MEEKKEDLGFSKGGFDTLEPFSTSEESEIPWYKQGTDEWYKIDVTQKAEEKKEHKPHAMLEEHEKHDHFGTGRTENKKESVSSEKSVKKTNDAPMVEVNKKNTDMVYLPNPAPSFKVDFIKDTKEYIKTKFENNPAAEKAKKGQYGVWLKIGIVLLIIGILMLLNVQSMPVGSFVFIIGIVFIIMSCATRGAFNADSFFLVKPYAVKEEQRRVTTDLKGLRIYYSYGGEYREAVTDDLYTDGQVKALIEAFREGKLVVACKTAAIKTADIAIIFEPSIL